MSTETLIGKLQKLADHLYSLDSDSGEAHLISEALMILREREYRELYTEGSERERGDYWKDKYFNIEASNRQALELLQEWHDLHFESNRTLDADETAANTQKFLIETEIEDENPKREIGEMLGDKNKLLNVLNGFYQFCVHECADTPDSGELVTSDIRPLFNKLCDVLAELVQTVTPKIGGNEVGFQDCRHEVPRELTDALKWWKTMDAGEWGYLIRPMPEYIRTYFERLAFYANKYAETGKGNLIEDEASK